MMPMVLGGGVIILCIDAVKHLIVILMVFDSDADGIGSCTYGARQICRWFLTVMLMVFRSDDSSI